MSNVPASRTGLLERVFLAGHALLGGGGFVCYVLLALMGGAKYRVAQGPRT